MNLCANILVNNVDETAKVIIIVYYDRLSIWNKQISVIHDFDFVCLEWRGEADR